MINFSKKKLENKEVLLGSFFELGGQTAVEAAAIAGLDFIIIDNEHGPFDIETTMSYIRVAELRGMTPVVRVKEISRSAILKSLDIGARALIIPCVENIDQVKDIIKWGKYPPRGERGFFFSRIGGYGHDLVASKGVGPYMDYMNDETWLIPQCETVGALEVIEEIAAMDGVDGIFIGPFDLSNSMGISGQFDKPEFKEAVARIIKACHDKDKFVMYYANDVNIAKDMMAQGIDGVAVSMDVNFLISGYKSMLKNLK